jgi:hypothetical protein
VYTYTAITAVLDGPGPAAAALSKVHGVHDVYLVFTGDLRIASFSMR